MPRMPELTASVKFTLSQRKMSGKASVRFEGEGISGQVRITRRGAQVSFELPVFGNVRVSL